MLYQKELAGVASFDAGYVLGGSSMGSLCAVALASDRPACVACSFNYIVRNLFSVIEFPCRLSLPERLYLIVLVGESCVVM